MCSIDWLVLLEYFKVLFGWPPIALVLAILFINRFRRAIDDFLARLVEGNIFGQAFKAVPPPQQSSATAGPEDRLAVAAGAASNASGARQQAQQQSLPPELAADPLAPAAISYIEENPAQTLLEYKRVLFSYHSERLFTRIYGTQVALLEYLKTHRDRPSTLSELAKFHDEHQQKAGSAEYQLRDYVGFLVAFGVVAVSGPENAHEYGVAENGVEFLSYIKANYPTTWNQRAF